MGTGIGKQKALQEASQTYFKEPLRDIPKTDVMDQQINLEGNTGKSFDNDIPHFLNMAFLENGERHYLQEYFLSDDAMKRKLQHE